MLTPDFFAGCVVGAALVVAAVTLLVVYSACVVSGRCDDADLRWFR